MINKKILNNIRIVIFDNEPVFTTGLKLTLKSIPGQEVVGIINDVAEIEEICIKQKPHAILMRDFLFEKNEGFKAVELVKRSFADIKVIMIMSLPKAALIKEAQLRGVDSCLLASDSPAFYNTCLWDTIKGKRYFPNIEADKWGAAQISLTEEDLALIRLTCRNMTQEQIADNIGVEKQELSQQVNTILAKTGHKDIAALIIEAADKGFLLRS